MVLFQVHTSRRDPGENGPVRPLSPNSIGWNSYLFSCCFTCCREKHNNPGHRLWQKANTATLLFYRPHHSGDLGAYCLTQVIKVQVSSKFYSRTKLHQENTVLNILHWKCLWSSRLWIQLNKRLSQHIQLKWKTTELGGPTTDPGNLVKQFNNSNFHHWPKTNGRNEGPVSVQDRWF